ncbi:MAG: type II toxin-antitoxin system YoeB family toxin [Lachnospiraceae bacterium]|nr:type II toxin-antitoxin system YoeB family toxin [Lachnospiraceae bacterium]
MDECTKGNLSGFWSRRISNEHRIVYAIEKDIVIIISCKGHYIQ